MNEKMEKAELIGVNKFSVWKHEASLNVTWTKT